MTLSPYKDDKEALAVAAASLNPWSYYEGTQPESGRGSDAEPLVPTKKKKKRMPRAERQAAGSVRRDPLGFKLGKLSPPKPRFFKARAEAIQLHKAAEAAKSDHKLSHYDFIEDLPPKTPNSTDKTVDQQRKLSPITGFDGHSIEVEPKSKEITNEAGKT